MASNQPLLSDRPIPRGEEKNSNAPIVGFARLSNDAFMPKPLDAQPLSSELREKLDPTILARALEASWDQKTAYQGLTRSGNPAFGQCYPTSRVVQWFYPEYEIAKGEVWTGSGIEHHFWNIRGAGADVDWLDLSWSQFPPGSVVQRFTLLDRDELGDSAGTAERCALLLQRVLSHLTDPSL